MNAVAKVDQEVADAAPLPVAAPPIAMPQPAKPVRNRRPLRLILMVSLPLLLAAGGSYFWVTGGRYEDTENANVRQSKVSIASDTSGRIVEVNLAENKPVKASDVLFRIDPEPYRIALAQADAALAAARLGVEQLRAAYSQAVAQERMAGDEVDYLKTQLDRQSELASKGINTKSALDQATHDLAKAKDEQLAALQGIASARAAIGGDPDIATDKHPSVLAALATRDNAAWNLAQTTVRAPADGLI